MQKLSLRTQSARAAWILGRRWDCVKEVEGGGTAGRPERGWSFFSSVVSAMALIALGDYCSFANSALACFRIGRSALFPEGKEVLARASIGIETSSSTEGDAIKVPVGGFLTESVAGAVGARRNVSLQHLLGDCA